MSESDKFENKKRAYTGKENGTSEKGQIEGFTRQINEFFQLKPVKGFLQTMDEFFHKPFLAGGFHAELTEGTDGFMFRAELPGVKRGQIILNVFRTHMIISIVLNGHDTPPYKDFVNRSKKTHSARTIHFPRPVESKNAKASYQDGLLDIQLPFEKGSRLSFE